jgi:hypothetical protein
MVSFRIGGGNLNIPEKNLVVLQVTDKLYQVQLTKPGNELTTLVLICLDLRS